MSLLSLAAKIGGGSWTGPGVYGSNKPGKFLRDMASGADSVDIVMLGDSNVGSAIHDFWGFFSGFCEAMTDRGWTCYGAPIMAAMNGRTVDNAPSHWRGTCNYFAPGAVLKSGTASGGSTPFSYWSTTANWTCFGASGPSPTTSRNDWAYLQTGSGQYYSTFGYELFSNHPLAKAGTPIKYRVRYGASSGGAGGKFCPMLFRGTTEMLPSRVAVSSSGANEELAWESVAVNTSGTSSYKAVWSFVGTGADVTQGPIFVLNQSIYTATKGWSMHSHAYLGGFSSDAIAQVIAVDVGKELLKSYLREIRSRQIAAGGSGRVLLVVQFGINGTASAQPETAAKWTTAAKDIWSRYKTCWGELSYPMDDLGILLWVSHPKDEQDNSRDGTNGNLVAVRAAANQMALDFPDMTVVDVKKLMPHSALMMGNGEIGVTGRTALADVGKPFYQQIGTGATGWPSSIAPEFKEHLSGGKIIEGKIATFTAANPGVISLSGQTHGLFAGDLIYINGGTWSGGSLTSGYYAINTVPNNTSFTIRAVDTATPVNTTALGTYTANSGSFYKWHQTDGYREVAQSILAAVMA